jgi:hypothetical protein
MDGICDLGRVSVFRPDWIDLCQHFRSYRQAKNPGIYSSEEETWLLSMSKAAPP